MSARSWGGLVLAVLALCAPVRAQERISHGRFEDVALYRPKGAVKGLTLLLADDAGSGEALASAAPALAERGALVARVDVPKLLENLEADGGRCVFPDGDLENLSHYLEAYAQLPGYSAPLLVGAGGGAALAYAMLAQAPAGTFGGAISLGFCPALRLEKPLCEGEGVHFVRDRAGRGVDLLPDPRLAAPWLVLRSASDSPCDASAARAFVARIPRAALVALPDAGPARGAPERWLPALVAAHERLAAKPAVTPPPPVSLADLPLVEVPAARAGDTFAVLLSGDGGWAGLDKKVAAALAADGIPVVGLDSLRYFWSARTPDGLASDLDRVLRYYGARWHRQRAIAIGYSQGADVLPFALNRLPSATRALVERSVLLGVGERASFEFHLANWVGKGTGGEPILPEIAKLSAASTLCIYGRDDASLCPRVPPGHVRAVALPGGHHFDGAYGEIAALILAEANGR